MSDLISRKAALKAIKEVTYGWEYDDILLLLQAIENIKAKRSSKVKPVPFTGKLKEK